MCVCECVCCGFFFSLGEAYGRMETSRRGHRMCTMYRIYCGAMRRFAWNAFHSYEHCLLNLNYDLCWFYLFTDSILRADFFFNWLFSRCETLWNISENNYYDFCIFLVANFWRTGFRPNVSVSQKKLSIKDELKKSFQIPTKFHFRYCEELKRVATSLFLAFSRALFFIQK